MPLTSSKFYQLATEAALALPGTELYRFTSCSEAEATRVGSKRFMLLAQVERRQLINPKAAPDDVRAIQATYPDAIPAWHMNKTHWYSIQPGPSMTPELVGELIAESYLTVVESLPISKRPAGWQDIARQLSEE
ncbi:MmcQ/YjbR family DNA-binding protein [Rothia sp. P5766]|uniref:MmcQ/YjbR family DNA-binding protein n=1 Tax=Rothia sp. P5766 TaxID=3402656 RepID=UPI003AE9D54D